jgi:putative oxidoreductase
VEIGIVESSIGHRASAFKPPRHDAAPVVTKGCPGAPRARIFCTHEEARMRFEWFEKRKEYGMFFVRLIVGFHLIYGTADNVFSWTRMLEFRDFLASRGVPWPLFAANLSAWAQFLCGILFILGLFFRPAAVVMIINFIAALLIAHRAGGYPPAALALMMLFSSIAFLIHGPGRPALTRAAAAQAEAAAARPAPSHRS